MFMSYYIDSAEPHIFIHIPKTAGRSIFSLINNNYSYTHITNSRTHNLNFHSTLRDVEDFICPLGVAIPTFTVVRNPWTRIASWYFFRQEILRRALPRLKNGRKTNKTVRDYDIIFKEHEAMLHSFDKWLTFYHNQLWDYTWFSASDNQVSWLKSNTMSVSKIIKFENLNAEITDVEIFKGMELPVLNKGPIEDPYKNLFNGYTRNLVKVLYEEDIDTFKYSFTEL
jgi:hypothetical protein|tara:strand:+ start:135 stop:812 length:678 start_codon:yes stop_codon:yes gene_type:complete